MIRFNSYKVKIVTPIELTNELDVNSYVYAPKDYDGLMVFFMKSGTSKNDYLNGLDYNKEYKELLKQYNETGEKSEKLEEIEKNNKRVYKLLEARYGANEDYKNDYFYVIRLIDINNKY